MLTIKAHDHGPHGTGGMPARSLAGGRRSSDAADVGAVGATGSRLLTGNSHLAEATEQYARPCGPRRAVIPAH